MEAEMHPRTFVIRDAMDVTGGKAYIADRDFHEAAGGNFVAESSLWLDMCLTPRPLDTKLRYANRWPSHRFERVGQLLVMPAGEALQFRSGCGRQLSIVCQIRLNELDDLPDLAFDWTDRRLESCIDLPSPRLATILRYLAEEIRGPGLASKSMVELLLRQIAIELARHLRSVDEPITIGGLAAWRLKLIEERLGAAGVPPSLEELSRLTALSVRQLTRAFRTSRGCSLGEYVGEFRMERAKRLLAGSDSVKTIAYILGFQSTSNFSHAFRTRSGMTPRQFRAQSLASAAQQ